ncbi:MAG TPA: trypsin-like peptidase domain-containing protein, partial [Methylomirabilota bacterium]|nr:trypsin-like peptidase domain-containing protein [Methylomirabilota bacterium]
MAVLEELQAAVARVGEQVGPSVVGVVNGWSHGSGMVIGKGRILTNGHNIRGDEMTVAFADGRTATARVLGVDVDGDLAVLEVDTDGLVPLTWAADATVAVGQPVFAVSNPGGRGLRVTFGLVSGTSRSFRGPRGRRISGTLEHTAPLLPGSSGGPVVNAAGEVLGINTNRLGEGFYLAIPGGSGLQDRIEALGRGETPSRPRLGVAVAPPEIARRMRRAVGLPERDGLLVRGVEEGTPADAAGLQEGDLIVAAGGRVVRVLEDLQAALDGAKGELEIGVVRGTEERSVTAKLG